MSGQDPTSRMSETKPSQNPLEGVIKELQSAVKQTATTNKLLEDPMILKLLQLRSSGKEVEVVEKGQKPEPEPEPDDDSLDYESLPNRQLKDIIVKHTERRVLSKLEQQNAELRAQLEQIKGHLQQKEVSEVSVQVERMRKRYDDFNTYLPVMQQMSVRNPDLTVEELYLLAKKRSSGSAVDRLEVASEKPTTSATRPVREVPVPGRYQRKSDFLKAASAEVVQRVLKE